MKINKKIFDNGLRLVHNEDTSTQMVALNIVYDVGARDEHPEHTGFAHLFEHLMFGGSVHIPDYDAPLQLAGGENNAWTNNDITNYYLTVPKSNVEIGFWLESDRMLELAFSEQSLEVQRAVVMEEFKQRCLNQPYGDVGHLLRPLAYQTHPYRWPTIGKDLSHIANATLDEVKEFFFRFYAPNNAVLAVTGNISWEETIRLTEKWFAPIPRRNVPVRQLPQEVVQTAERRQTVERNVPLDALFMAYHMCSREDADYYAFDILSDILSNGRSSRLTRRLVQEQKLFSSLDAYISGTRDAGLLHISGKPSAFRDVSVGQFGGECLCQHIFHQRGAVYLIAVDDEFFGTICFQRMGYVWHIQILYSIAQHIFPSLGRNGSYHGCGAEGAEHKFSHCFHFSLF